MKLNDLLYKLEKLHEKHGNIEIVLSSDGEGNSFKFLYDVEEGVWLDRDVVYPYGLDPNDDAWFLDENDYNDYIKHGKTVVVLWP